MAPHLVSRKVLNTPGETVVTALLVDVSGTDKGMSLERYRVLRTVRIDSFWVELIHAGCGKAIKFYILNKIDSILIEILFTAELGVIYN